MNRMMQAQSQPQAMLVSSLPDDKDQERGQFPGVSSPGACSLPRGVGNPVGPDFEAYLADGLSGFI
jgi:hypothetical protein